MATRNTRYWRSFLNNLLPPPNAETSYDGVCVFTLSGRVEYRDGCFQASSSTTTEALLDVDPSQFLSIFDQLTRQAIYEEQHKHQEGGTAPKPPRESALTPALRLGGDDCTFHVVSATFSSLCAVASGKTRGLVAEKLPFGVLVVAFSTPLQLETVFGQSSGSSFFRDLMYFCAACKVYVKDASVAEHDQTTAHLLSSSGGVSVRKVWLPETNRGYQMLKAMGWQEDSGLGPAGGGKVTPIATTFKTDRAGVGVQSTVKQARVTHFPPHNEQQARMAADGRSEAQRMQDRLARKRKQQQQPFGLSKAQRKLHKQKEQRRDRAIADELYAEGLEGYEEFLR